MTPTTSPGSGSATTTTAGLSATWKDLRTAPVPFGEQAWNHARQLLAAGSDPATEAEIAAAAADLLDRAGQGPRPPASAGEAAPGRQPPPLTALPAGRRTHRGHRDPGVAPPGRRRGGLRGRWRS